VVNSDRWEVNKTLQASPEGPGRTDIEIIKTQLVRFTREFISLYTKMSPAKQSRPQTVQWLMPDDESYFLVGFPPRSTLLTWAPPATN
jgi:hypothetical protein